jgi:hypothetical protein
MGNRLTAGDRLTSNCVVLDVLMLMFYGTMRGAWRKTSEIGRDEEDFSESEMIQEGSSVSKRLMEQVFMESGLRLMVKETFRHNG